MNLVTISDARAKLPQLVKQAYEKSERFLITVSGKPKAVLIGIHDYQRLIKKEGSKLEITLA